MFTEQNIPQGSSSPSHTAGECHGFSVKNISFNKASTELHRKWKISINTASLVVHIPAAVGTIDSADPKHISPASHSLTASTITAATSPTFGFPVLCSCCWGRPQAIVQGTNILTHFLWGDSTKSVSHISTVFKKTGGSWSEPKQALNNIQSPVCYRKQSQGLMGITCMSAELKVIVLSSFTHPHNIPNMIFSLLWNKNGKIYLDNRTMEA